ncbi:phage major capsid protein [Neobacillus notoginsengisoli]|nr:phage major capsid protein [Neobacillus notoginsengisoli]
MTKQTIDTRSIINSHFRGKELPGEIRNLLTTDDKNILLPEDLRSDIERAKKHNKSMSQYVDVISVSARSGIYSTEDEANHEELHLIDSDFDGPEINEQALKMKGVRWEIEKYGSFTPISESLYRDTAFDLLKFFENAHAEKATKTENKLIFKTIRTSLTPKQLGSVVDLKTSLNMDLNPALENEVLIVTNQDGLEQFNHLTADGDPVKYLQVENEGPKRFFDIYRLEVYSNDDLPSKEGKAPFIYGSFKRTVKLFSYPEVRVLLAKNPFGLERPFHVFRGVEELDVKIIPKTTQLIYAEIPLKGGN